MKIIFAVFYFNLMNLFRNFKSSGIMFILPIVFMGIFAVAFGSNATLVTINSGIYVNSEATDSPDLKSILSSANDMIKEVDISSESYDSLDSLKSAIEKETINTGIVVNKSEVLDQPVTFTILGKQNDQSFQQNRAILSEILTNAVFSDTKQISTEVLDTNANESSVFSMLAPGLMVYGLLILIPGIAISFASITDKNYIFRFANSKARSAHIIAGSVLYYILVSLVQILILYFTATMFGFKAVGNIFVAFVPALLTAIFVIGIGLLVGSFAKKPDSASNIGSIISIILGFFSGSFIAGIGGILEFKLFGQNLQFNDFLPSKWGTSALEKILGQNLGFADIQLELLILGLSGVLMLILGIFVYQKWQLNVHS